MPVNYEAVGGFPCGFVEASKGQVGKVGKMVEPASGTSDAQPQEQHTIVRVAVLPRGDGLGPMTDRANVRR